MRSRLGDVLRQADEAGIGFQLLAQDVRVQSTTEAPKVQSFNCVQRRQGGGVVQGIHAFILQRNRLEITSAVASAV